MTASHLHLVVKWQVFSHIAIQSIQRNWVLEQTCRLSHLAVCLSVSL